nr:MAG TPA: helix-turn-helix domain protein [Caudoviricetes sp.]
MNISKIDALCRKNSISRTILEERAGISNGALGKWEKSPYGPSITTLKKVADYFGVPVDYLLADN